jgi:ribonuclease HII
MKRTIKNSRNTSGPTWEYELRCWNESQSVAGIDEAGRGPLAGPVVASAVLFTHPVEISGLRDSKKMTLANRERCYDLIREFAVSIGVAAVGPTIIDQIGILNATYLAMRRALAQIIPIPDCVLVDGRPAKIKREHLAIVKGDDKSFSIAAASVVAKVLRDRMMTTYDRMYPEFNLAQHKGYPTPQHLAILKETEPSPIHRLTFAGVQYELF